MFILNTEFVNSIQKYSHDQSELRVVPRTKFSKKERKSTIRSGFVSVTIFFKNYYVPSSPSCCSET